MITAESGSSPAAPPGFPASLRIHHLRDGTCSRKIVGIAAVIHQYLPRPRFDSGKRALRNSILELSRSLYAKRCTLHNLAIGWRTRDRAECDRKRHRFSSNRRVWRRNRCRRHGRDQNFQFLPRRYSDVPIIVHLKRVRLLPSPQRRHHCKVLHASGRRPQKTAQNSALIVRQ